MSEGTEYPKVVTGPGGVKHTVASAAEEDAWVNAPLPPGYVPADSAVQIDREAAAAFPVTGSTFGVSPMVEIPSVIKKGKGASHA